MNVSPVSVDKLGKKSVKGMHEKEEKNKK